MNQKTALVILFILLFLTGGLLYYNLFIINKKELTTTTNISDEDKSLNQQSVVIPTSNPTMAIIDKKLEKIHKEGGEIPFDYEVISVSPTAVAVTGLKGSANIPNDPLVKVFKRKGDEVSEASFSDLALGQRLIIERAAPPSKEIKVYILEF